ncbi:hypothetical protein H8E77_41675 [bacterium]|nr:hypothetical protein [bacterium]
MRRAKDGFLELSLDDLRVRVKCFEEYYGVSSEEFLQRWRKGDFEDTFWTNLWRMDINFLKKLAEPGVILESDFDYEEKDA